MKEGWCVQMVSSKNEPVDGINRKDRWYREMVSSMNDPQRLEEDRRMAGWCRVGIFRTEP